MKLCRILLLVSMNKVLEELSHGQLIHSCIISFYFCITVTEVSSCDSLYALQTQKYLLSSFVSKSVLTPDLRKIIRKLCQNLNTSFIS